MSQQQVWWIQSDELGLKTYIAEFKYMYRCIDKIRKQGKGRSEFQIQIQTNEKMHV